MALTHNLGFPRMGAQRELKFALEQYWRGETDPSQLLHTAQQLRQQHWQHQAALDLLPVGDFSLYDHVLDASFMLGVVPERVLQAGGDGLDQYFRLARGRTASDCGCHAGISAGEMTKWFDTNYHYIVPEFSAGTRFTLQADHLLQQIEEARAGGHPVKPVIIGPVTYLWLGKSRDDTHRLDLLAHLLPVYRQLLARLHQAGIEWVQIDEPVVVTELAPEWRQALRQSYDFFQGAGPKLLLTSYFGELQHNLELVCELPVAGLHVDAIRGASEIDAIVDAIDEQRVLSLGVINGRNIWKTDLEATLDWLEPLHARLQDRLWLAPSCSLLHVPLSLRAETELDAELKNWLAFAEEKLDELTTLAQALNHGRDSVAEKLQANRQAVRSRQQSARVHNPTVKQRVAQIDDSMAKRQSPFARREAIQRDRFGLPLYPATTIGSFPQTPTIRQTRRDYRNGDIDAQAYKQAIRSEIAYCIEQQEKLELDVLVHGEAERNDMVEYFGEQLSGYAFTRHGWVQSYGSRCVKPPILYGDISRPHAMTVEWSCYAQSLTRKPVKGMLTGPVTMLNWSFVRDDQPRSETCLQLALAIRDEVLELEAAGISMIQIDEAALREGLPLRQSQWQAYLDWAIQAFRISANGVQDDTQIHTHMCYAEFNDIIDAIARMDADVITIETSRSDMELLDVFEAFDYPNQIGPGVYDIHSPNVPDVDTIVARMQQAARRIPAERLWVNPDCGLKTRQWEEVIPALKNMVAASRQLAQQARDSAA